MTPRAIYTPAGSPSSWSSGWPRPPQYLLVDGRDVVLVLLENGYVYAFDQAGGAFPGFPISMGARLASGALVEPGPTLRRTRLTVVSQHGERVTFNLSGDVVSPPPGGHLEPRVALPPHSRPA